MLPFLKLMLSPLEPCPSHCTDDVLSPFHSQRFRAMNVKATHLCFSSSKGVKIHRWTVSFGLVMLFIRSLSSDMKIPISHRGIAVGINYRLWFKTGPSLLSSSTRNTLIRDLAGTEGFLRVLEKEGWVPKSCT